MAGDGTTTTESPLDVIIESTPEFLTYYDQIEDLYLEQFDDVYLDFFNQLENQTQECDVLLGEVSSKYEWLVIQLKIYF